MEDYQHAANGNGFYPRFPRARLRGAACMHQAMLTPITKGLPDHALEQG